MTIPIVITAATAISSIRDLFIIKNFCHKVISFGNSNSYVLHFFQQRVSHNADSENKRRLPVVL